MQQHQQGTPIFSTARPVIQIQSPSTSTTATTGQSIFDSSSPKMIQLNIAGGSSALIKSGILTSTTSTQPTSAVVNIPQTSQGDFVITSSAPGIITTMSGFNPQQRHPLGYTIATIRGNTMAFQQQQGQLGTTPMIISNRAISGGGGQTIQLQTLGLGQNQNAISVGSIADSNNSSNSDSPTTPIIIRSVAGDLMLPGHIALGKGGNSMN
jgi:hypothetical protein